MARIPRSEESVRLSYANQPTISGDALTGPGRALQGLGRAISGLAADLAEPSDGDLLSGQMAALKSSTEAEKYYNERVASLTPETDPDAWHQDTTAGVDKIWDENSSSVSAHPKVQQSYSLNRARFRSHYDVQAHQRATTTKVERNAEAALNTFSGALEGIDPTTPAGKATLDMISEQLRRVPGLDQEKAQKFLAEKLLQNIDAKAAADPLSAADEAEGLQKSWGDELRAPPGDDVKPGPLSFAEPPLKRTVGRPRSSGEIKALVLHQTWGSDTMEGNGSWSNKKGTGANYYIDKDGTVYQWAPDEIRMGHIGRGRNDARPDLVNDNTIGIEIMTRPNERPNERQIAAARQLAVNLADKYGLNPSKDVYGHGELTVSSHRRKDEAIEAVGAIRGARTVATADNGLAVNLTAYSPQKGGDAVEGGYRAATAGPDQDVNNAQTWKVNTLADVAAGRSKYVTLAGNKETFGKSYRIPEISFVGADGKARTLKNVLGVVHDTGPAFRDAPEGRFDVAIDKDATKRQREASHALWKQAGVRFVPETAAAESVPAVGDRALTRYAGMRGEIKGSESQDVAAGAGRIPGPALEAQSDADGVVAKPGTIPETRIAGGGLTPQEFQAQQREALANAQPGEVRQPQPAWRASSIRTKILDGLADRLPALQKAREKAMLGLIERAEKVAADGYVLPESEQNIISERLQRHGTPEMQARYQAAIGAGGATAALKRARPDEVRAQSEALRADMAANGATPETIATAKAIEGLHTKMVKELNENSVGWAIEAGVIPDQEEITPENFSADVLSQRKQAVDLIASHYGAEFRSYFRKEERRALEESFSAGGEPMLAMMATMYESFGDDMPKAVAEIAPKAPEAVRAGYLVATGGDPRAAEDIAATIKRRADPNYKSTVKFDRGNIQESARSVLGDAFKRSPASVTDATLRAAEAIYEARVEKPENFDDGLFKEAIAAAVGERKNGAGIKFGGVAETRPGLLWGTRGDAVIIPSNVRQDTFRQMLDEITVEDLAAAGHPLPTDGNGNPLPITQVMNGRLVQSDKGKYRIALGDPDIPGAEQWVGTRLPAPDGIAVENAPQVPFELDLDRLTPILRKRNPEMFLAE